MTVRARGVVARFKGVKPDPENARALDADHPAAIAGRTIFPGNVASTASSARFLISGVNNAKIGGKVEKGPWAGMPIFTLTLEERATCPRSCEQWLSCYGNSQHWPKRWDHTDPQFLPALEAEIITTGRLHRDGFVVRLHVLGDFYSPAYVLFWARMLVMVPALRVYGYTACRTDDADLNVRKTAEAIKLLTDAMWSRFAIRTSTSEAGAARSRAIVVEADPEEQGVIVCPAATGTTEACSTCALCWSETARDKTIAFLLHGMTRRKAPRTAQIAPPDIASISELVVVKPPPSAETAAPPSPPPPSRPATVYVPIPERVAAKIMAAAPALFSGTPEGVPIDAIMEAAEATYNQTIIALGVLKKADKISWDFGPGPTKTKVMLPAGSKSEPMLTEHQKIVLDALSERAGDGVLLIDRTALRKATGLSMPTFDLCVDALRRKGFTERVAWRAGDKEVRYRILKPSRPKQAPAPPVDSVIAKAPGRETVLWERAEPVAPKPTRAFRATDLPATDLPATPAPPPEPAKRPCEAMAPLELPEGPAMAGARPLTALRVHECHWPLGDPEPVQMYCGEPAAGGQYCAVHAGMMFLPKRAPKPNLGVRP